MPRKLAARLLPWLIATAAPSATPPSITSLVRSADFGQGLIANDYATIYGQNLSDGGTYQGSGSALPVSLGGFEVFACEQPANIPADLGTSKCPALPLIFVSPGQVNFYVPANAGTALFAQINGVSLTVSGNFTQGLVEVMGYLTAPAIFIEGFDCFIDPRYSAEGQKNCGLSWNTPPSSVDLWCERGAVTDLLGNLLTSSNPAHVGDYVSMWVTGLGIFGTKTTTMKAYIYNAPLYGSPTFNAIGPYPFFPSYSGESQFPGLYQINMQIPPAIQCGDQSWGLPAWPTGSYNWDLLIGVVGTLNGVSEYTPESNGVWVPVIVRPGDVVCQ
jgi:uncharacterized protein (TIGR03437 family)